VATKTGSRAKSTQSEYASQKNSERSLDDETAIKARLKPERMKCSVLALQRYSCCAVE